MHPCTDASIHSWIYASMHPCIHASMHPWIDASMYHLCMHASMHLCIHVFVFCGPSYSLHRVPTSLSPVLFCPLLCFLIHSYTFSCFSVLVSCLATYRSFLDCLVAVYCPDEGNLANKNKNCMCCSITIAMHPAVT